MPEIDGPVLLVLILVAVGYWAVDSVKQPIHKAGHAICQVVTFGQKCAPAAEPCPPGFTFLKGSDNPQSNAATLHGCYPLGVTPAPEKPAALLPPLPFAEPPCPKGYVFLAGDSFHGCFDAKERP